ncbi:XRE family transcriptional regulator [Candidatus Korobacter versatilis]|nr:XRE family transcriptional regulator [Candidatus Koribacter versatilis]
MKRAMLACHSLTLHDTRIYECHKWKSRGFFVPAQEKSQMGHYADVVLRLRAYLKMNQSQFADALGVTQASVSRWEQKGASTRGPSRGAWTSMYFLGFDTPLANELYERAGLDPEAVKRLARDFRDDLSGRETTYVRENGDGPVEGVAIPLLTDKAAAGQPRLINEKDIQKYLLFPREMVPHPTSTRCMRVRGDSMAPIVDDGYIVAVDTSERDPRKLVESMVAVSDPESGCTIKWLRQAGRARFLLVPQHTSPRHNPIVLDPKEEGWRIIGRVLFWIGQPPPARK